MLELKWHSESKLQNVNHNLSNIHQHVTIEIFQGQEGTTSMDPPASLGLSLADAENQRTTKHPRIWGLKVTRMQKQLRRYGNVSYPA